MKRLHSHSWDAAGKGGEPEERGQYPGGTDSRRGRNILPPAASGAGGAGLRPAGARAAQERERRIPLWRWLLWWFDFALGILVFYVLLTPIWIGLRGLAWLAEFRARRRRAAVDA